MTKVLLTTVFKPFGLDNPLGSHDSFPEGFHNRLTTVQGIFSYRNHMNSFGLHVIASNISADCKVLEYPTLAGFKKELSKGYDFVGIGSVLANFGKVRVMCEAVRLLSPRSKIVLGGYCVHAEDLLDSMPVDYICTGEGISFMRELLGDPPEFEFKNPDIHSISHSFMGVPLFGKKNPHIIVGLGCPKGCEYCSPSHHFGRKYVRFYRDGAAIFKEMERMEKKYKNRNMSLLGDDNFLTDQKRADQLRQWIVQSGKQYELFYFCSADMIDRFTPEKMAEMGTSLVWVGRESCFSDFRKTRGVDFKSFVEGLHRHGIKVVLSSMLFMEHHDKDNIWQDIRDHLTSEPDFTMFCTYSPVPGTPLYERVKEEGGILDCMRYEEVHGVGQQYMKNAHFTPDETMKIRGQAVSLEYETLGPSTMRWIKTDMEGYRYMSESDNPALRARASYIATKAASYKTILLAMSKLVPTPEMKEQVLAVLSDMEKTFGKSGLFEKTAAAALTAFGIKEKIRQKYRGDVIQPHTTVTRYP